MYIKEDIIRDIENLGIKPTDTLLIHSSMKSIGNVENGADTIIDAFIEYMETGLLIFPTHTWYQMNHGCNLFDVKEQDSCVGILSNIFRKRPNVFRSLHPTHSIAAIGERAEEYVKDELRFDTPNPIEGCWGRLYDEKAKILLIGCKFDRNTYIHAIEEWCDVPGRLKEHQATKVKDYDDNIIEAPMKRHINFAMNYRKIEGACIEKGITTLGKLGDAECLLNDAKELWDLTVGFLNRDLELFTDKQPVPESWYKGD